MGPAVPQMDLEQHALAFEEGGEFTQYQNRVLLVFIYQTWEDYIRPQIAKLYDLKVNSVCCHLMGDLKFVCDDIIHRQGRVTNTRTLAFLSQLWTIERVEWKFSDDEMRLLIDQLNAIQVFVEDPPT